MDNLDSAIDDLGAAHALDPADPAVGAKLGLARARLADYRANQRKVYAGMFTKFATLDSTVSVFLLNTSGFCFCLVARYYT